MDDDLRLGDLRRGDLDADLLFDAERRFDGERRLEGDRLGERLGDLDADLRRDGDLRLDGERLDADLRFGDLLGDLDPERRRAGDLRLLGERLLGEDLLGDLLEGDFRAESDERRDTMGDLRMDETEGIEFSSPPKREYRLSSSLNDSESFIVLSLTEKKVEKTLRGTSVEETYLIN